MRLRTFRASDAAWAAATERAACESVTLSSVLRAALEAYAAGEDEGP
jgi:hypothetical protein